MANPQTENGHLRIAHEVLEALIRARLSGAEYQIIFSIMRASWGWRHKSIQMSISDLLVATNLSHAGLCKTLAILQAKNIIKCLAKGGGATRKSEWSINKDWETWNCPLEETVPLYQTVHGSRQLTVHHSRRQLSTTVDSTSPLQETVLGTQALETKELQPPKSTNKETNKEKEKNGRRRDLAYDEFTAIFATEFEVPYAKKNGDFVQLAALRKLLSISTTETPQKWTTACQNYCRSPMGKYSLADLCTRYAVFANHKLNEFGKPEISEYERLWGKSS